MKVSFGVLLLTLIFAQMAHREAEVPFFSRERNVVISSPDRQNYIVVDQAVWAHSRADLADIRIYDAAKQVPYVLTQRRSAVSTVEQEERVLNLGSVGGHTQFDIDVSDLREFDRIRLQLDAKNFVATAEAEGRNELRSSGSVKLGRTTLYDFTQENLGSNFVLKLPPSNFHYLHVRLNRGIKPVQVKGAVLFNLKEENAVWNDAGACHSSASAQPRNTTFNCEVVAAVPVGRIQFEVSPTAVNFRRTVVVADPEGAETASGEISRIRMLREGQSVVSESLAVHMPDIYEKQFTISVENGDDAPLPMQSVRAQSIERRIYFHPEGRTALKFYYGDEQSAAPIYDYAKFFREDSAAVEARLGPDVPNPAYTGRPDTRPWSEQHKSVLWFAMLLAVAVLGGLALRGFRKGIWANK